MKTAQPRKCLAMWRLPIRSEPRDAHRQVLREISEGSKTAKYLLRAPGGGRFVVPSFGAEFGTILGKSLGKFLDRLRLLGAGFWGQVFGDRLLGTGFCRQAFCGRFVVAGLLCQVLEQGLANMAQF